MTSVLITNMPLQHAQIESRIKKETEERVEAIKNEAEARIQMAGRHLEESASYHN